MDEPSKHYAKWMKPDTETTCCMIPFIWNVQQRHIQRDRKQIARGWKEGGMEMTANEYGVSFGGSENVDWDSGDSSTTLWIY